MLDEREFERWFEAAKRGLESARGDLDRGDYNWACFKAQQAAELAVKGLLHGLGMPAYGHSVSRLLRQLEEKGLAASEDIVQAAKDLDKYYVPTISQRVERGLASRVLHQNRRKAGHRSSSTSVIVGR